MTRPWVYALVLALLFGATLLLYPQQYGASSAVLGPTTPITLVVGANDAESRDERHSNAPRGTRSRAVPPSNAVKRDVDVREEERGPTSHADGERPPTTTKLPTAPLPQSPTPPPPLAWPPVARWDAAAMGRPEPSLAKDDHLGPYVPLGDDEWWHDDVDTTSPPVVITGPAADGASSGASSRNIQVRYGILAVPSLLYTRVIPLLNTSMLHADAVDVFIRRTSLSYAVAEHIMAHAAVMMAHMQRKGISRSSSSSLLSDWVRVVELEGPNNEAITKPHNIRNAWMDLEVMKYWGAESRRSINIGAADVGSSSGGAAPRVDQWYCIVDDDGYPMTRNVKEMLAAAKAKDAASNTGAPSPEETPPLSPSPLLIVGSTHVYRKKKFKRTFVVGGPGIYFTKGALIAATEGPMLETCMAKHVYGGGDIRASFCLVDAGARLVAMDNPYFDSPMRAVGEAQKQAISLYPVSFHRMRERMWLYRLAAIEARRYAQGQLVTWGDLSKSLVEGAGRFYRSQFYPREYDNYTMIYFAMTKESLAQYNKKRKRPLNADPM